MSGSKVSDRSSSTFAAIATLVSVLSLLLSGVSIFQTMALRQQMMSTRQEKKDETDRLATPESVTPSPNISSPSSSDGASGTIPSTEPSSSSNIQPGQFIQPAFSNSAEVELLAVKRLANPQTGKRDVVNVQFRVRRLGETIPAVAVLHPSQVKARNPETSETYQAYDGVAHATNGILLMTMRIDASADGYVWMRIPEKVTVVDLLFNETQAFKAVPISG